MALEAARGADLSELQTRIASAVVLVPVAIAALAAGGAPFTVFVALVAAIGLWEWTGIAGASALPLRIGAVAVLVAGLLAVAAFADERIAAAILLVPTLLAVVIGRRAVSFRWTGLGLIYLGLPSAGLILLRQAESHGFAAALFILVTVWATDIAAFFGGRAFGGPKLWPRLSPKKTWSGAFCGLAAALVFGGLAASAMGASGFWAGALVAAPLSVAAQAGDLLESAVKRRFGVKDSGAMIPGHGGVLDRIDGLLGAAALAWLIALLGLGGRLLALPSNAGFG